MDLMICCLGFIAQGSVSIFSTTNRLGADCEPAVREGKSGHRGAVWSQPYRWLSLQSHTAFTVYRSTKLPLRSLLAQNRIIETELDTDQRHGQILYNILTFKKCFGSLIQSTATNNKNVWCWMGKIRVFICKMLSEALHIISIESHTHQA